MAFLNIDLDAVEASSGFSPIPEGRYLAIVSDSSVKQTKAGTGEYLALKFQIIDGDFSGRLHWENLNINNPNAEATKIAHQNLKALAQAVGAHPLTDSEQLHDKPVYIVLKADKKDPDRRVIRGYDAANGAAPVSSPSPTPPAASGASYAAAKTGTPAATPPAKPATGGAPPWKK